MGITERKIPAFKSAMTDFLKGSELEHPGTHRRYQVSTVALRKHFADTSLDLRYIHESGPDSMGR